MDLSWRAAACLFAACFFVGFRRQEHEARQIAYESRFMEGPQLRILRADANGDSGECRI
jgi:hypothetical protein